MPWFVSQARATGVIATNFSSPIENTGSLGAYLWLSSGATEKQFGCNGNGCTKPITDDNIFRELDMRGMTWKVYAQSLPSSGYMGDGPYPYVKRHNPAVWYSSVLNNTTDKQRVVPFTEFQQDLKAGTLPEYSVIIPDLTHDVHDGTLAQADAFLQQNIGPLLGSKYFRAGGDGLLFLTFDECGNGENGSCGSHIFSAIIGPSTRAGYLSNTAYSHSDMLHTIEDVLGLQPYFGGAASGRNMTDFFATSDTAGGGACAMPSSPGVSLCTPIIGQSYGSPVEITALGRGASGAVNHMELWIDGHKMGDYPGDQMSSSVALGLGNHSATAVEVDSKGAFVKSKPTAFTVASCSPPASSSAKLCFPVAGQTYGAKVQIVGAGALANGVSRLELWIDGHKIGNYAGSTINTAVTEPAGLHQATLVAVDAQNKYVKSSPVSFQVQ